MDYPPLVRMPLLTRCDGEAVELALGVSELNTVACLEETATYLWSIRHVAHLMRDIASKYVNGS